MNKREKFFKEINGGNKRGAQAKMARDLKTSISTTNKYFHGIVRPSENHIKKMAGKYMKSEKKLKNIFDVKDKPTIAQNAIGNKAPVHQIINHADVEFFKAELKTLEAKMDLLLERAK